MPEVTIPIDAVYETIVRKAVSSIVKDIKHDTGMSKNAYTEIMAEPEEMRNLNSNLKNRDTSTPVGVRVESIYVQLEESFTEDTLNVNPIYDGDHKPIFYDPMLDVLIKPVYIQGITTLQIQYVSKSKNTLYKWIHDYRISVSRGMASLEHNFEYVYVLPKQTLILLKEIHALRESVAPYGDTLSKYIHMHQDGRLTTVGDTTGGNKELGVRERQSRISGFFDIDITSIKPEFDKDKSNWSISFSYKVTYDKPIAIFIRYPCIVHNQLLPERYVLTTKDGEDEDPYTLNRSRSFDAMKIFESATQMYVRKPYYFIRLPVYDSWNEPIPTPYMAKIFQALCIIEEDRPKLLLNLNDLGDIEIASTILDYMRDVEYPYLTSVYKSMFSIVVFKNDIKLRGDDFYVDSDLNVYAHENLDRRANYRVIFSLMVDLTVLHKPAFERMKNHIEMLHTLVRAINVIFLRDETIRGKSLYKPVTRFNISRDNMDNIIRVEDISDANLYIALSNIRQDWKNYINGRTTVIFSHILTTRSHEE